MAAGNQDSSKRFIPSGVDAHSWLGFEQRIQARRFTALVHTIDDALAREDLSTAAAALEEARELRPDAPELVPRLSRVARLSAAHTASAPAAFLRYRALGAVAMFLVGIGLVIAIESFRSPGPGAVPVTTSAAVSKGPAPFLSVAEAPPETSTLGSLGIDEPVADDARAATPETPVATTTRPVENAKEQVSPPRQAAAATVTPAPERGRPAQPTPAAAVARRPELPQLDPQPDTIARREVIPDDAAVRPPAPDRSAPLEVPAVASAVDVTEPPAVVATVTSPPVPVPQPAATAPARAVVPRTDNSRVEQVLTQYARAYGRLDPGAARAVWPTVDERALSRAFASLASQDVSFDACNINVSGTLASASCQGTASYVGKIGNGEVHTEARRWEFELKLHGDDWKIEKARAQAR